MKIQNTKNTKLLKVVSFIVVVAAVLGATVFAVQYNNMKTGDADTKNYPSDTKTSTDEGLERQQRNDSQEQEGTSSPQGNSVTVSKYTPTINSVMFNSVENGGDGTIAVRVMVTQATSGSCELKASTPSGRAVEQKAALVSAGNYYVCEGFTIPSSQVNENGEWTISVVYIQSDGARSSEVSRKVTVY